MELISEVYTVKDLSIKFDCTVALIRKWQKEGKLISLPFSEKLLFSRQYIDSIFAVTPTIEPQEQSKLLAFTDLTQGKEMKAILLLQVIHQLDGRYKQKLLDGDLSVIKHLPKPNLSVWESLVLALEGVKHKSFWWSELGGNIYTAALEEAMQKYEEKHKAPVIAIMGGGYRKNGVIVQPDNKAVIFCGGLSQAVTTVNRLLE